jgi:hypothetical protein
MVAPTKRITLMQILILVIASNQPEHQADLESQKKTWVSECNENVSVIYLRGWDQSECYFEKDVLFVPIREEYSNILHKTIIGINYILDNFEFDVLVRSNVSTYFETNRLVKELNQSVYRGSFFGGYFDKSKDKNFYNGDSFEYISGTGVYLSKDVVIELSKLDPNKYTGISEDLAIYDFLKDKGFKTIRMARNNLFSTHFFIPTFNIRVKNTFNSKSASRRMQLVHNFFYTKSLPLKLLAYFKIQINEIHEFLRHPEYPHMYLIKNRVVLISFLKMKLSRLKNYT